jgi:periplasmic divalent cation tolerance protein
MKPAIIISTYPNKKSISKIANDLVKNKTVACVNISKISSIYSQFTLGRAK